MTAHARILNNTVVEIVDLDPAVRTAWIAAGNPKADSYLPIIDATIPAYDPATHALTQYFEAQQHRVVRGWTVRPLTAEEKRKSWTPLQFLERFTSQELDAIEAAVPTDPIIRSFYRAASFATEIVSDDPRTVAGVNYLVSEGILTMQRKNEILNGA